MAEKKNETTGADRDYEGRSGAASRATATSAAPSGDATITLGSVAAVSARRGRPRGSRDSKPRATRSDSRFAEQKDADGNKIFDSRQQSLYSMGVRTDRPRSSVPAVAESKDSAPAYPHSAAPLPTADKTTSKKEVCSGLLPMLLLH